MVDSTTHACPRCGSALAAELSEVGLPCGHCAGVFIRRERVHALLASAQVEGLEGTAGYRDTARISKAPELEPREAVRYLKCPVCSTVMTRQNFARKSGVLVDVCPEHGTWFDGGEVERASAFIQSHGPVDVHKDDLPMQRPAIESRLAFMELFGRSRRR